MIHVNFDGEEDPGAVAKRIVVETEPEATNAFGVTDRIKHREIASARYLEWIDQYGDVVEIAKAQSKRVIGSYVRGRRKQFVLRWSDKLHRWNFKPGAILFLGGGEDIQVRLATLDQWAIHTQNRRDNATKQNRALYRTEDFFDMLPPLYEKYGDMGTIIDTLFSEVDEEEPPPTFDDTDDE